MTISNMESQFFRIPSFSAPHLRRRARRQAGAGINSKYHTAPTGLLFFGGITFYKHTASLGLPIFWVFFFYKQFVPLGLTPNS
jgi:hypothetical protein